MSQTKSAQDHRDAFTQRHHKGERLTVRICQVVNDIGLFCDLEKEAFGIVHLSDIDWAAAGEEAVLRYECGQRIEVVILTIQPDRQRVCLGIKQLKPGPRGNL